jgi:hypothetical protein
MRVKPLERYSSRVSRKQYSRVVVDESSVLGIESLAIPLPEQQTFFCVTLDNGIDYIRTPYSPLMDGARVNQEFSL